MRVLDVSGEFYQSAISRNESCDVIAGQSLAKLSQLSGYSLSAKNGVAAIIADGNNLFTLQGIQLYPALIQVDQ